MPEVITFIIEFWLYFIFKKPIHILDNIGPKVDQNGVEFDNTKHCCKLFFDYDETISYMPKVITVIF